MDQTLLRVFSLMFCLTVVIGCGSDSKKGGKSNEVTGDAAVDAGDASDDDDTDRDAATGGAKPSTGMAKSCDDVTCSDPATCKEVDGKATCACPAGYDDP